MIYRFFYYLAFFNASLMIYVSYNNSYCSLRTLVRLSYKKKLGLDAQEMKPILLLDNIRSYVHLSTFFTQTKQQYIVRLLL